MGQRGRRVGGRSAVGPARRHSSEAACAAAGPPALPGASHQEVSAVGVWDEQQLGAGQPRGQAPPLLGHLKHQALHLALVIRPARRWRPGAGRRGERAGVRRQRRPRLGSSSKQPRQAAARQAAAGSTGSGSSSRRQRLTPCGPSAACALGPGAAGCGAGTAGLQPTCAAPCLHGHRGAGGRARQRRGSSGGRQGCHQAAPSLPGAGRSSVQLRDAAAPLPAAQQQPRSAAQAHRRHRGAGARWAAPAG